MPEIHQETFQGGTIRVYGTDTQGLWFFAEDVFSVLGIPNGGEVIATLPDTEKMTLIFSPNESDAIIGQSLIKPDTASRIANDVAIAHRAETQQENWLYRRAVAAFDLAFQFQNDINEETYQRMLDGATQLWEEAIESEG